MKKVFCVTIISGVFLFLSIIMCSVFTVALANEKQDNEQNNIQKMISVEKMNLEDCITILNEKYQLKQEELISLPITELKSLIMQAEANNFTEAEVQNYVSNLLNPTKFDTPEVFVSDDNSLFYSSDGRSFPNLLLNKHIEDTYNPTFDNSQRIIPKDQAGTYWKTGSIPGFLEATGYIRLPSEYSMATNDRIYIFLSGNLKQNGEDLICQDFGIVYESGVGWYPTINAWKWDSSKQAYSIAPDGYSSGWIPGPAFTTTEIYIQFTATNTNNIDLFRLRIFDENNSLQVLYDNTISWLENPLNTDASNWCIERKISMTQHDNGILNIDTGSYLKSTNTYSFYLYTASQGYFWEVD